MAMAAGVRKGVVGVDRRAGMMLVLSSIAGIFAFAWPFFVPAHSASTNSAHSGDAPYVLVVLMVVVVAVTLAELSEGRLDVKSLAILGMLAAGMAALRIPSPGMDGFEPMWFLLILAARVFGPGFGFVLGAVGMATSALLTGGIGPWLPYQMLAAGWVGLGAGLLPGARGRAEMLVLSVYGFVSGIAYGAIMNLWFWPFVTGSTSALSFSPSLGPLANLHRFVLFDLATSLGFDLPRAIVTTVFLLTVGPAVLRAMRRVSRRALFVPVGIDGQVSQS